MRIAAVIVLSLVGGIASLPAQEATKPNTLTPKEIADGWILLFDGETTLGWRSDAPGGAGLAVKNHALVVGALDEAMPTPRFAHFEIRADYQIVGANGSAGMYFPLRGNGAAPRVPLPPLAAGDWGHVVVRRAVNRDVLVQAPPATGMTPDPRAREAVGVAFGTVRGTNAKLLLRNVKLQPLGMKSIFNGKDLTGWHVFPGKKSQFTAQDGAIVCQNGPGDLQTDGKYANFILQLECKSNGKHLNSGVFFRCKSNEYQNGYETQIHNNFTADPPKQYTVEEYDPETHKLLKKDKVQSAAVDYGTGAIYRRVPARKAAAKDGEWFTMTIVADGNHIATWVNGIQQVDWYDHRPPSDNPRTGCRREAGHISIQGHDPTTNLSFRNIRIAEFPDMAK